MAKKSQRGNYYKKKSREYLEGLGYETEYIEKYGRFFNPKTKQVGFIKRDLFAADGLSMNGNEIIFWNSVFNRSNIADHYKKFKEHKYPENVKEIKRWILVWELRVREPEIIEIKPDQADF